MEKKSLKRIGIFIAILLVAALGFGIIHLSGMKQQSEKVVRISWEGKEKNFAIHELTYGEVEGIRINGKGEEIPVAGKGILLKDLLAEYEITDYRQVKVTAIDSYWATVSSKEIQENSKVYLFLEEESLRLLVFGDKDSKRSVSGVVQITVE